jgi:hypothetical protein
VQAFAMIFLNSLGWLLDLPATGFFLVVPPKQLPQQPEAGPTLASLPVRFTA